MIEVNVYEHGADYGYICDLTLSEPPKVGQVTDGLKFMVVEAKDGDNDWYTVWAEFVPYE